MQRKKSVIALLLVAAMLTAVSCGGDAPTTEDTTTADTTTAAAEPEYEYADIDCGGEDFNIFNVSNTWGFNTTIYYEEATGDTLSDAVYNANVKVEEAFNVKLKITESDITQITSDYTKIILSGDDVYQAALTAANRSSTLWLEGYVQDLSQLPQIHLNEEWWDQNINAYSSLGGSDQVYFAVSDINLMSIEVLMGIYVNDDMLEELGRPTLYDTVREGKWTLDVLHENMKAATNLNGDDSFTYSNTGNAVYGMTYWESAMPALLFGSGVRYVTMDKDNMPQLAVENDHFYDVAERVASMFAIEGETVYLNSSKDRLHYEDSFEDGRALFTCAQLKASANFRDMEDAYGILPLPKYDEAQEEYYGYCSANVVATTIPKTNPDPERAAAIMDAMAYHAHTELLPVYYGVNVEQKQVRNEDSIEMLGIMSNNRVLDIGLIYGWTKDLDTAIYNKLKVGDAGVASVVASNKESVQALFDSMLEQFQ